MEKLINNFDAILADPSISSTAKLVLLVLKNQETEPDGTMIVRDEQIAITLGRGVREISRSFTNLGLEVSELDRKTRTRVIKFA